MVRRRLSAAAPILALMLMVLPGQAQEVGQVPSPVLTLDQERLFNETDLADQVSAEFERRSEALAAENRRIEAELEAEELALTEKRAEMAPDAFRELADAFDAKVQRIREEQDAKARELQRLGERGRQDFLRRITPILAAIVRERGAFIVLDRRSVFLSADQIDITEEAIRRINAAAAPLAPGVADDAGDGAGETPAAE